MLYYSYFRLVWFITLTSHESLRFKTDASMREEEIESPFSLSFEEKRSMEYLHTRNMVDPRRYHDRDLTPFLQ
jgi:hypothetical protein